MSLNKLPSATVKKLYSSQVISSVFSAVKELVENSVDSGATSIDIKLINYGLDSIEVQDNGCGVPSSQVRFMCLPHFTSKISDFADLGTNLMTYGFRGEALSSLCNVSTVKVVTRTSDDEHASNYSFDNSGQVIGVNPSHFGIGTTILALNIFSNLPVRRRYMSSSNRLKTELKKIETMIKNFAIVNYKISFTFCHNLDVKWQKSHCSTFKESVSAVMGYLFGSQLDEVSADQTKNFITLLLPKQNCNNLASICLPEGEAVRIFINQRPVEYKKLQKVIAKCFNGLLNDRLLHGKIPFSVVIIKVPPNCVDVNIEPNKTKLMCHNEDELIIAIERLITNFYELSCQGIPDSINMINTNGKSVLPKHEAENSSSNLFTNSINSSCTNQQSKNNKLSDDTVAVWSRGHIVNPDNQDTLQGGATLLKRRAGQLEEQIDDSQELHEPPIHEPKRKFSDVGTPLKKSSNHCGLNVASAKETTSISNHNGQLNSQKIGFSHSRHSTSSPKLLNNSISEMFCNNVRKEGKVKNSLSWYELYEKSPLKFSVNKKKSVALDWNFHSIVSEQFHATNSAFEIQLLHQLPNGIWMYEYGKSIGIIRHKCLKENKLYEQFLRCCGVPVNRLQNPILLSRKDFLPGEWQNLLSMKIEDESTNNELYISNEILTKNGLKLAWVNGEMLITHMASSINFNGIEELREILKLLNTTSNLSQCRPAKVKAFFKSEAVRASHKKDVLEEGEMKELLNHCHDPKASCHGKPIFVSLHTFP